MRRVLVLAGVLVLSGCGGEGATSEPAWFADRQTLPSCEAAVLDQGDAVPDTSSRCLFGASADAGAELEIRSPTTEGIPSTPTTGAFLGPRGWT